MVAPAGLNGGSVPEPTESEPPDDPDPAGAAGEESALGEADPWPEEAAPAAGTGPARRTSPLAVAAVILGLIALAGVAVGILVLTTHGFRAKSVVQYRAGRRIQSAAGRLPQFFPERRGCDAPFLFHAPRRRSVRHVLARGIVLAR